MDKQDRENITAIAKKFNGRFVRGRVGKFG